MDRIIFFFIPRTISIQKIMGTERSSFKFLFRIAPDLCPSSRSHVDFSRNVSHRRKLLGNFSFPNFYEWRKKEPVGIISCWYIFEFVIISKKKFFQGGGQTKNFNIHRRCITISASLFGITRRNDELSLSWKSRHCVNEGYSNLLQTSENFCFVFVLSRVSFE